ncbi:DUF6687 family protein [Rufibacter roseus]|uniref:DUF6687 family protein n=1 Tax=Rufibacter roseus TaxID=1567108 RepID=A0ABW2DPV1_9BACT|nr:DUF6687 family protein [Rufibacter roseus]
MAFAYLPFTDIQEYKAVVVDSYHPNGLVLSHWRGSPTPEPLREDTSAGIVLQALKQNWPSLEEFSFVTANHFDVDGFVGVWALLNPELALQHEELLRQMAIIGDFRELNLEAPFAEEALKLVCWLNAEEKTHFYPPFGAGDLEENEITASVPKFHYFLHSFTQVLQQPDKFSAIWEPEFSQVRAGYLQVHGPETRVEKLPELGLVVIQTPEPVHYYALFSVTAGFDVVLSCYSNQRYELECKYTTWVDIASRPTLPRPDMRPLAQHLTTLEVAENQWKTEGPTDTGPLLRIHRQKLSKAQRYAHPYERPIYSSSISPAKLTGEITKYLTTYFSGVAPKQYWSWAEIKGLYKKN